MKRDGNRRDGRRFESKGWDCNSPLRPVDATRVERADTVRRLATMPRAPTRTVVEETAAILLVASV